MWKPYMFSWSRNVSGARRTWQKGTHLADKRVEVAVFEVLRQDESAKLRGVEDREDETALRPANQVSDCWRLYLRRSSVRSG